MFGMQQLGVIRIAFLFLLPLPSRCFDTTDEVVVDPTTANKWTRASSEFDELVWPQRDNAIQLLQRTVNNTKLDLNPNCRDSLAALSVGLAERKFWSYKFLDASSRGQSGFAHGYIADLGYYDECLSIHVKGEKPFAGQYCMVNLKFPLPKKPEKGKNWMRPYKLGVNDDLKGTLYEFYANHTELFFYETFSFAVCVPSTCSRDEVDSVVQDYFKGHQLKAETRKYCQQTYDPVQYALEQPKDVHIALIIVLFMHVLVVLSTIITYHFPNTVFSHFCAITNTLKLTKNFSSPYMRKVRFLDGFKFYYHTGATFAHLAVFLPVAPLMFGTMQDFTETMDDMWLLTQYTKKAFYMTQIIFFVSGFFSCYFIYPILVKMKGKIGFVEFVVKRWLRTAPATFGAIAIMFAAASYHHGPVAREVFDKHLGNCRDHWWATALYINNWQRLNDICLPQTWSQSVDFQLWILSYFPLIWLATKPRLGVFSCLAMIALGVLIPSGVAYFQELPSHTSGRPIEITFFIIHGDSFPTMHFHPYNNMASYFVGILIGYMCAIGLKFKYEPVIAVGAVFWTTFILSIFGPAYWTDVMGGSLSLWFDIAYAGFFRLCYIGPFALSFYSLYFHADRVGKATMWFWENTVVVVLGRLAFSVYLAQLIPMAYDYTVKYERLAISWPAMLIRFSAIMMICWVAGLYLYLTFEAPSMSICKTLLEKLNSKSVHDSNETNTQDETSTKHKTS